MILDRDEKDESFTYNLKRIKIEFARDSSLNLNKYKSNEDSNAGEKNIDKDLVKKNLKEKNLNVKVTNSSNYISFEERLVFNFIK